MSRPSRRIVLSGAAAAAAALLVGCSDDPADGAGPAERGDGQPASEDDAPDEPPAAVTSEVAESLSLSGDAATLAAAVSALLLTSSPVAVLTPAAPSTLQTASDLAAEGRWPVLVVAPDGSVPEPTARELTRLGVEHALVISPPPADTTPAEPVESATDSAAPEGDATTTPSPPVAEFAVPVIDGLRVHEIAAGAGAQLPDDVPVGAPPEPVSAALLAADEAEAGAALATAAALGCATHTDQADPREDSTVMTALRDEADQPLVTLAAEESTAATLLVMAAMAQRAPELPGGGVTLFPHKRLIALYGHPGVPVLGLLGEQNIEGSIERVGGYVEQYSPLVEEQVIPAWEIIASVATGGAGPDGSYSKVWEPELFRPWVDAAREAGVYVVLDLQPGRTDFLTQAKEYEELLVEPHVGLALDPEWRLGPGEKHLVRIGHVEAAEINAVSEWLAELVRENDLPQKILTLHQFQVRMIRDREQVRTDHPELAVILHADGQGGQGAKQDTWRVLQQDLPENMWLGWKNFYDEDAPMLTPEQTIAQVDPTPWFISYQ